MIAGKGNKFTCAACSLEFTSNSTEEEAQTERKANGFENDECGVVCDNCYKKVMEIIKNV